VCTEIVEDGDSKAYAQMLMRHTDDRAREIVNRRGERKVVDIKERRE
jgi:hypothetical protein